MTTLEPGGSPSAPALDVDRVEWVPGERGTLEVRVFGVWRGPEPAELAFLLVDDGRQRHMFPALSTPPTSRPGMWSAAFPVPGELRPLLGRPLALRVGIDEMVLPAAQAGAGEEQQHAEVVDRAVLAERRARRAELAEEELGRRAVEAERAAAALEAQLGGLEERLREVMSERDAALARVHERDRAVLSATQREHAERALREEVEEEHHRVESLLRSELDDARARLADVEGRAEEAERLRARLTEAQDQHADLAVRVRAAEQERAALAERLRSADEERAALAERLAAAQTERTDLLARLDAAEEQRGGLSDRLAALEVERDELTDRATAAEVERGRLAERLEEAEARRKELEARLAAVGPDASAPPEERTATPAPETRSETIAPVTAEPEPPPAGVAEAEPAGDLARTLRAELADERARREQELVTLRAELGSAIEGLRTELARLAARAIPAEAGWPEKQAADTQAQEPAGAPPPRPAVDRAQGAQLTALAEELERARPRRAERPGQRLVADLGAAARRLRENGTAIPDGEADQGPAATAAPPAPPEADRGPAATAAPSAPPEADRGPAATAAPPAPPEEADQGPAAAPAPPAPAAPPEPQAPPVTAPFRTRVVPEGDRYEDEWLAEAVEAIADDDTALAARIVVALLPAQRHVVKRDLHYELAIEGAGTYRVVIAGDEARVEQRTSTGPGADDIDFSVSGPVRAVARLATGSARWRLRGARVQGSRRRLWRLLRARRAPLSLAALARTGEHLDPGLAFTLLARAVDRRWTDDHPLEVTYRVTGDQDVAWRVATTGGAPLTVTEASPSEGADGPGSAVVEVPAQAFLPLLAREPLPEGTTATVSGDPPAVARLHAWFDRVQGLPIED